MSENEARDRAVTQTKTAISRRAFLTIAGGAGAMLGLGGLLKSFRRRDGFIRPPGVVSEENIISLCLKCDRCIEACPTKAITPVHVTQDPTCMNTPQLDFDRGYCDFCMECIEVCPTGALQPVREEDVKLGVAVIDPESCIAWNWVGCTLCLDLCPYEAIKLDGKDRHCVVLDHCNGCGWCEYGCDQSSKRVSSRDDRKAIFIVTLDEGGIQQ